MPLRGWFARSVTQAGAPGLRALAVSREEWSQVALDLAATGARLVTLWASQADGGGPAVRAMFLTEDSGIVISLSVTARDLPYPRLDELFPAASRMQRAIADLCGLHSTGADSRPWLRHAAWPQSYRPLADSQQPNDSRQPTTDAYDFVRVEGDGVHEIAVGPVHAGIIEPGHFRFSVVGEKVLRLEERLGYVHKGIERRFTELPILEAQRLAARISGDSTVAFSWAYCQALEGIGGIEIPARAAWLRALYLELERLLNHLGDLGALGNDAGFAFGLMQFSRLKELLLRASHESLGERYLMNCVEPGGACFDLTAAGAHALAASVRQIAAAVLDLRAIYDEHEGMRDRFIGAGTVAPTLALRLGLTGLAGRASGQAFDLRTDMPCAPYTELSPVKKILIGGDVAARVAVRFDELQESCRLIENILAGLPAGPHTGTVPVPPNGAIGIGLIESWRGPVAVALEAGPAGAIRRCHPHDPSWLNWPVIEHAIIGNIVPDFPLINKSFNLSYSGHDL